MNDLGKVESKYGCTQRLDHGSGKRVLEASLPIHVKSANDTSHWRASASLVKKHAWMVRDIFKNFNLPELPVHVTFIRVAPRKFDDDNLMIAFKGVRDTIAQMYFPDTRRGMADSYECFTWEYRQEKGEPKEYSVRLLIQTL